LNIDGTDAVAALAAVNTTLSAGMAGMSAIFINLIVLERTTGEPYFDLTYLMNGSLSGLVAITGGCAVFEPWVAVIVGFVAGLVYLIGSKLLIRMRIDDAVDAVPVHLFVSFVLIEPFEMTNPQIERLTSFILNWLLYVMSERYMGSNSCWAVGVTSTSGYCLSPSQE
jgi:Ammonium Transporter Family